MLLERRMDMTRQCERAQGRIIAQVFYRSGRPMKAMGRSWEAACRRAGVPSLILHDLRRSAVRNLERAGVSRSVAMKLTGHKTESVCRRYAIVAESDLADAGRKLSAGLVAAGGDDLSFGTRRISDSRRNDRTAAADASHRPSGQRGNRKSRHG